MKMDKHSPLKYSHGLYKYKKYSFFNQLCKNYNPSLIQFHLLGGDRDNPENYAQGKNGGHPSAEGHKIMAEKVIELIDAI